MKRPFWGYLLVLVVLALFGSFAWLTRNPDAEILRRAESWPYVGGLASRFREAYLPPPRQPGDPGSVEKVWLIESEREPDYVATKPRVFERHVYALAGERLRQSASERAPVLYEFESIAKLGKIERRGDWFHVYYHGREGWVLLEGYDEDAEIPYGETPDPPKPVPSRAPDEERLAAARKYLRGKERVEQLGSYTLYTDSSDDDLIAVLATVAEQLEALYALRYGRTPLGDPAEAIVLYQSDIAYRLLQQQTERIAGLSAAGHNTKGVAVFYSGGRRRSDVAATLVHELAHFINRRALGPHLPPWLDEGIADDLAGSRFTEDGRIDPGKIGGERLRHGNSIRFEGGFASILRLRDAVRDGSLPEMPELISSDWESFVRSPKIQLHYAAAAFWVRYLLQGEDGRRAGAFRAFLGAVADGEAPSVDTLGRELGEDWGVLNAGFRAWIEQRAAAVDVSAESD